MEQRNAEEILLKYKAGTAAPEEKALIEDWALYGSTHAPELSNEELLADLAEIRNRLKIGTHQTKTIRLWRRIAAAAAILVFLLAGSYFILSDTKKTNNQLTDIGPGTDKAILTLADGSLISLTNAKIGQITKQGETVVSKTSGGEVVYKANAGNNTGSVSYNTITIPKAGKWHIVLPDGSKAWLDAFSSIRFPTVFNGGNRTVEITGQVYFEVIHNAARPFKVIAKGQTVEDIGTYFNINAYADEPTVKTTLVEGSVKVSNGKQHLILKPGQQSVLLIKDNNKLQIKDNAGNEATAWKDGYFEFYKASIQTVMRQFSRWYDVDVEYEGQAPTTMITGKVPRNVKASEALKILSYLDIHFRIADKKIIITP